jgi:hypothetical protein
MADKLDKGKITEELELLQLEETRERVQKMRNRKSSRETRIASIEQSLADEDQRNAYKASICWHRKGGKGAGWLQHGDSTQFAVIKHTLSHGPVIVICQRCPKVWAPPDPALNAPRATQEQKREYKRLYDEYVWALNLPTDNEPSGTQLFMVNRFIDAVA